MRAEPVIVFPLQYKKQSELHDARPPEPQASFMEISTTTLVVIVGILIGLIFGTAAFVLSQHHAVSFNPAAISTPAPKQKTAYDEIILRVGKLMTLPAETPTIAIVSDINALKDQAFFKNAKNGDFVLMFAKARRAVLYDPSSDKVLEVAPITDGK